MKKIRIENLRSLQDTKDIAIMPLTVLVGKNSVGKSTFLRTYPLFKQSISVNRSEPLLWYSPELVDFGNFKESVNNHDENKSIGFTFEFDVREREFRNMFYFQRFIHKFYLSQENEKESHIPIRVSFEVKNKYISNIEIKVFEYDYYLEINKKGELQKFTVNNVNVPIRKTLEQADSFAVRKVIPSIELPVEKKGNKNYIRRTGFEDEMAKLIIEELKRIKNKRIKEDRLENIVESFIFTEKIKFDENFKNEISKVITMNKIFEQMEKSEKKDYLDKLYIYNGFRNINTIIEIVNSYLDDYFANSQYIAPIRASAQRYYRIQGLSIDDITPQGENVPMILNNMKKNEEAEWRKWTREKFGIEFIITESESNVSMKLVKEDEEINLADTGFGYSQLLPILLYTWKIKNVTEESSIWIGRINTKTKTLVIEQPELHLHPALQAKLIDIFVEIISYLEGKLDFSIIMETHSETIINRIGYHIALNSRKLNSEKVNILLFNEDKNKNICINQTSFSDDGSLEAWPADFFMPDFEGDIK